MTCFQVEVNGERVCVAGLGEFGVLTATLSWVRNRHQSSTTTEAAAEIAFNVGGLTDSESRVDEFVDWVRKGLSVGDEVRITIVDVTDCDEPKDKETTRSR